ncbi:MAG: 3-phosphoserine/phosphohydroxythreonine transaminase [Haliscomenobacter sp.]|nr:3-phosphoserine/phosphohydroxythreonine transaminase [Haliscomenobacter sp.]
MKKHNFNAGPAILPSEVFAQAAEAMVNYQDSGLSLLEISHRSKEFEAVMAEAEALVRELFGLTDDFAVLFLSGGASSQFFMAPMNLLNEGETAGYLDTGSWSSKAIKEAKLFGKVEVLASSKAENYAYIPSQVEVPGHLKYLHLTSNNTIFGTQYHWWPSASVPLVADMSSDIFSRPIDMSRFGLIYAGAQKNMGPAGVTLVILRKDLAGKAQRPLPAMLDYQVHMENGSMYNTPPVYAIYLSMLTLRWVKAKGGLKAMDKHNREKARLFYHELDHNPLFRGNVIAPEDRSLMNATFLPARPEMEKPFLDQCKAAGIEGLKGHRSVGGFRASMYNAMPLESVQVLVEVMQDFARTNG